MTNTFPPKAIDCLVSLTWVRLPYVYRGANRTLHAGALHGEAELPARGLLDLLGGLLLRPALLDAYGADVGNDSLGKLKS